MEENLTLKPKFCFWVVATRVLLSGMLVWVFMLLNMAFVEGEEPFKDREFFMYASLFIIGGSVIVSLLGSFIFKLWYARTVYTIKANHVEVSSDFIIETHNTARFSSINEIRLRRGPLQRMAGIGTIVLLTRATALSSRGGITGFHLRDVENAREIVNMLQERVE